MSWVQNAIRWLLPDEGPFYELIGDAGEAAHKGAELLQELIKVHGEAPRIVLIERIVGELDADRSPTGEPKRDDWLCPRSAERPRSLSCIALRWRRSAMTPPTSYVKASVKPAQVPPPS